MARENLCFGFIKPDAYDYQDAIFDCFIKEGMVLRCKKEIIASEEKLEQHYIEHKDKDFYRSIIDEIRGRKIVLFILSKDCGDIVTEARDIITKKIRPTYGTSISKNACHGSDSTAAVKRECLLWYDDDDIHYINFLIKSYC